MTSTTYPIAGTHVEPRREMARTTTLKAVQAARASLADLEERIESELNAAVGTAALEQALSAKDGWKRRCLDSEAALDAARAEIAALTARVDAVTQSLGTATTNAAPVAADEGRASPVSPSSAASFEALRVAAACALVAMERTLASSTTYGLHDAAVGLRAALAGGGT